MQLENDLGNDPVRRLVWRIALPSMLAQFVSVLYSIVDRIYIGNIPAVGDIALAGVGVCGPIITMVGSVAFWIGIGGAPTMSIRLGEGNTEAARRMLSNAFLLLLGFSAVLMAVVIPLREPMLYLFGASSVTYPYADVYFTAYLTGTPFALLSVGLGQFIIAQGFARVGMKAVLLGAVLNILLDPLFIFVFDLGVRGAAIATVLSQAASAVFALLFLKKPGVPVPLRLRRPDLSSIRRILLMGFPPFMIIAVDNLMIIAMNAILQRYGGPGRGDLLVTCATIVQSFMLVLTMPLGGISGGTQTILAYNYGARRPDRVLGAQKQIFLLCASYAALMFLLARLCGGLFVRLFTQDPAIAEQTLWAIRVCTLAIIPLGVQYAIVDGFTALGHVKLSVSLSFFRKVVYFAAVFALPALFAAETTFYAETISDVLGPLVSIAVYLLLMKRILRKRLEESPVPSGQS